MNVSCTASETPPVKLSMCSTLRPASASAAAADTGAAEFTSALLASAAMAVASAAMAAALSSTTSAAVPGLKFAMPASVAKSAASTCESPSNVTLLACSRSCVPALSSRLLTESVTT